ncbi:nicotinate-nucleotide pyrophosphorylase (carboxylating) [Magnetococcus marinus MC-1]|uniref:Probable nicotinate-nucleotide pyrophosphorylase [carboxylating] n=1 Tax=Magnetococcus marinus (strain ATCC BAA-1437 / JCM 17883 / MC-1) TaxID=156889 RepID=A0L7P1_MAGMM|nr:carboxylating nicotinate-nucleotide diphosphorylase [Magnetococcus marinus]ABK43984.1 nicotinate-nucleotide pyrophosphorylase (carboxylating) [Magnetococcus marinus MC-1]
MTPIWSDIVRSALAEDIGRGDITTNTLIPAGKEAEAVLIAREELVVCGLPVVSEVFKQVDSRIGILPEASDGAGVMAGNTIFTLRGPARGILTGERVALNFFQNLSAVASLTSQFVEKVAGTGCRIVDTRKTVPGMRLLQKYAVRVGGGHNHRMGLDDGVLIKENHIAMAGSIREAVAAMHSSLTHLHRIEVECETLDQVVEALEAGAHILLLDNMTLEQMREAVKINAGRTMLEASGNVTLETVRDIAETGVDMISSGALTHSAGNKDVSLLVRF